MPVPTPGDLADAGGWAVAVFEGLLFGWLLWTGRLVPREFYNREARRADSQADQADQTAKILARLTTAIRRLGGRVRDDDDDGT